MVENKIKAFFDKDDEIYTLSKNFRYSCNKTIWHIWKPGIIIFCISLLIFGYFVQDANSHIIEIINKPHIISDLEYYVNRTYENNGLMAFSDLKDAKFPEYSALISEYTDKIIYALLAFSFSNLFGFIYTFIKSSKIDRIYNYSSHILSRGTIVFYGFIVIGLFVTTFFTLGLQDNIFDNLGFIKFVVFMLSVATGVVSLFATINMLFKGGNVLTNLKKEKAIPVISSDKDVDLFKADILKINNDKASIRKNILDNKDYMKDAILLLEDDSTNRSTSNFIHNLFKDVEKKKAQLKQRVQYEELLEDEEQDQNISIYNN